MSDFLIERYVSRAHATEVDADAERARRATEEMAGEGTAIRHLRSIFIPEDETCFDLFRAPSADVVRQAALRAGLVFDRIIEVCETGGGPDAKEHSREPGRTDRSG
jgi:hypothetical protein